MLDWLVQVLFQYRPAILAQSEVRFAPSAGAYAAAAIAIAAIAVAVASYRRVRHRGRRRDRAILIALRLALLALLLVCLFRPVLVVKAAVPQQNVLGVLVDDSRSMQIADWRGEPRAAFVRQSLGPGGAMLRALSDRFIVRFFRFSSAAARVPSTDGLTFAGSRTRVAAALDGVRQELAGLPLAGLVLVSDGAATDDAPLADAVLALKAERLPVFAVGVGATELARDLQIDRVSTPSAVLKGTSLLIDVVISHRGYAGQSITVDVEDEGRIVGTRTFVLPAGDGPATVRVRAAASEAGPRLFRFRVPPQPGEVIAQNNVRETLIDVRDRREKILYFEGEPRPELKFIRRAVADDPNVQVVTLQRTADNKYLRLDVDGPDELVSGFPTTRDELFAYRGLILGSVEAGAFSGDQLRMIAEFVDRRGGGLLMLGGPRAFGEGGYAGTAVADVLPVGLDGSRQAAPLLSRVKIAPTRAGEGHAVTQIADTEAASAARWKTLPSLTSVNAIGAVKAGATVLIEGTDERERTRVVLASQRYGRGKALALAVQDSWLWQMHASVPVDDPSHENFWRQLLRWLVDGVPGPVELQTSADRPEPGEPVTITAHVVDPTFVELDDAQVAARLTRPTGSVADVPLLWTGRRPGEYRGSFPATEPGDYEVRVEAFRAGKPLGTALAHVRAAPGDAEYFDAAMQAARLQRIAGETGGRFYTPETAASLPDDLRYAGRGVTTTEERELWHMPIVLAMLVGLMCAEWAYRRRLGLA